MFGMRHLRWLSALDLILALISAPNTDIFFYSGTGPLHENIWLNFASTLWYCIYTSWAFTQFLIENILMGAYGRVIQMEKNELILQNYVTLYIFW